SRWILLCCLQLLKRAAEWISGRALTCSENGVAARFGVGALSHRGGCCLFPGTRRSIEMYGLDFSRLNVGGLWILSEILTLFNKGIDLLVFDVPIRLDNNIGPVFDDLTFSVLNSPGAVVVLLHALSFKSVNLVRVAIFAVCNLHRFGCVRRRAAIDR